MTTTTLFSKRTRFIGFYKSTFRRNIGYFGLFSALIAVFYPFQYAMEAFKKIFPEGHYTSNLYDPFWNYDFWGLGKNYTPISVIFFTFIMLLMPLILALTMNSYMHSKKAADVYHALPLERGTLLAVNLAVSMTYITVPVVLSSLAIAIIQAAKFGVYPFLLGHILLDTLGWLVCALAIYVITAFVSTLSGTVFDTLIYAGTALIAAPTVVGIYYGLASVFLFGFSPNMDIVYHIFNMSPLSLMISRLASSDLYWSASSITPDPSDLRALGFSNTALAVWLVLSIAIFFVAMKLYRRRNSELAETTTSRGVLPLLAKLVGTFACASFTGSLFYAANGADSKLIYILWGAIGGLSAYAVMEAVLNRGFKTLLRSLPLGILMVAVSVGSAAVLMTGGLGYENRIPDAGKIVSVTINYGGAYTEQNPVYSFGPHQEDDIDPDNRTRYSDFTLTQPQDIETVRTFHTDVMRRHLDAYRGFALENDDERFVWANTMITYHLKNGSAIKRRYGGVGGNTLRLLAPLEVSGELLRQTHPAFFTPPRNVEAWVISDIYGANPINPVLSETDTKELLEAIQADLLAQTVEELRNPAKRPAALIRFENSIPPEGAERAAYSGTFLAAKGGRAAAFLEKKGILSQIEPNLSDCYAVVAGTEMPYYGQSGTSIRMSLDNTFETAEFGQIKEDILRTQEYKKKDPDMYQDGTLNTGSEYAYEAVSQDFNFDGNALSESPETIRLAAAQVVRSYDSSQPLVYAKFYFKNAESGSAVLIPYDQLPQELKDQLSTQRINFLGD